MCADFPLDLDTLADALAARIAERLSPAEPTPRYLSVAQTATYTGMSTDAVRGLLASRKVTALRPVRGRVLIDRHELDTYMRSSTARPRTGRGLRPRR